MGKIGFNAQLEMQQEGVVAKKDNNQNPIKEAILIEVYHSINDWINQNNFASLEDMTPRLELLKEMYLRNKNY